MQHATWRDRDAQRLQVALWDRREMRSLHHTVALATGETFERR
jgi:hypothetical protein